MGYAERSYSYRSGGGGFGGAGGAGLGASLTPWVKRLLVANVAIWLLMWTQLLPFRWTVEVFGFTPGNVLTRPWSPLSYMFVHGNWWHVGINMLILFFFGPPLERTWGGRRFLRFYLTTGVGAALFSFLLLPLPAVSADVPMVGASGAIFGVMLAFAMMWPEAKIYIWGIFPMRAKWFVGLLAVFTIYATFAVTEDGVAHWAHLGGLITGFVYLRFGDRIADVAGGIADRWDFLDRLFSRDGEGGKPPRRSKQDGPEIRYRDPRERDREDESSGERRAPRDRATRENLDEVDRILDKIREEGIESLTEEERRFLDEMSRRYRG